MKLGSSGRELGSQRRSARLLTAGGWLELRAFLLDGAAVGKAAGVSELEALGRGRASTGRCSQNLP